MKNDCVHFDTCEVVGESSCCNAGISMSDICGKCGEHCDDTCYDCEMYITEEEDRENRAYNEAEAKYKSDKEDNL